MSVRDWTEFGYEGRTDRASRNQFPTDATIADTWDGVVKAATKILGDKAKIPKINPAVAKSNTAQQKSYDDFNKVREDLKKKLLALQKESDGSGDAYSQFQDEIDESDCGLNGKDKEDAKKISEARKILSGWLQTQIDTHNENHKNLRELDRHLMDILNYKQGE